MALTRKLLTVSFVGVYFLFGRRCVVVLVSGNVGGGEISLVVVYVVLLWRDSESNSDGNAVES